MDRWFMSLSTSEGGDVIQGVKIVVNHPLLRTASVLAPSGQIIAVRVDDIRAFDPGLCDFGKGVILMYFTAQEMVDIFNEPEVKPEVVLAPYVSGINAPPVTFGVLQTTPFETAFSYDLNLSASDAEGHTLTFTIETAPGSGSVSLAGSIATYTPNLSYEGADSFSFKANDGLADSNISTVSITVEDQPNTAPIASPFTSFTAYETAFSDALLAYDGEGDALVYQLITNPSRGVISGFDGTTGDFTYTPNSTEVGDDSFTWRAYDGEEFSNVATYNVTIDPVSNVAPVATASEELYIFQEPLDLILSASDVDLDPLTYVIVSAPSNGTITPKVGATSANEWTYTPATGFTGTDTFTFKANDGSVDSNVETVTLKFASLLEIGVSWYALFDPAWELDPTLAPSFAQARHQNPGITSGTDLSVQTDWSGNSKHAVQAVGAAQPTLMNNPGLGTSPYQTLDFDGGDIMITPTISLPTQHDQIVAALVNTSERFLSEHGQNASSYDGSWFFASTSSLGMALIRRGAVRHKIQCSVTLNEWASWCAQFRNDIGDHKVYNDGVDIITARLGSGSVIDSVVSSTISLGARYNASFDLIGSIGIQGWCDPMTEPQRLHTQALIKMRYEEVLP